MQTDEEFDAIYDGYTFEASFGSGYDTEHVELCPGGMLKALTRANADEFVDLYLRKLTEQDAPQFERLHLAIQDCVGERMLSHLTPQIACSRTCSKAEITTKAFDAVLTLCCGGDDEWRGWFFEIFDEMSKEDRMLLLKFMSGNSRLNQGQKY